MFTTHSQISFRYYRTTFTIKILLIYHIERLILWDMNGLEELPKVTDRTQIIAEAPEE